ncbi:unnamed protein product [Brassica oleracea var. botrytis]|uniref:BnaC02g46000D protein n=2 Tax=Brassica napus TaxID=3708 RepID=A0A078JGU0_BRANA|nr:hypothetical protein HID58_046790 [Brassica napus]CAF1902824.1 unnamed protein product [Brassica napus]CDY64886.1 BnaC02g46000D [Brassica napus]
MESLEHCLSSLILYNAATSFIPFGVLVLAQQELDKFTQLTNMFPPLVFQFFEHNVADLIRTGEYALSQLKQGKIPNNTTQY